MGVQVYLPHQTGLARRLLSGNGCFRCATLTRARVQTYNPTDQRQSASFVETTELCAETACFHFSTSSRQSRARRTSECLTYFVLTCIEISWMHCPMAAILTCFMSSEYFTFPSESASALVACLPLLVRRFGFVYWSAASFSSWFTGRSQTTPST